jgi:hypothetical protein
MFAKSHLGSSSLVLMCGDFFLPLFAAFSSQVARNKLICPQVLLDSECRPWLMEVNSSPALSMDGPVDADVKVPLLKDTFQMVTLHTRAFNAVAARSAPCGRSPSVSLSKATCSSGAANPNSSVAADSRQSSRSLSAPRCLHLAN